MAHTIIALAILVRCNEPVPIKGTVDIFNVPLGTAVVGRVQFVRAILACARLSSSHRFGLSNCGGGDYILRCSHAPDLKAEEAC